MALMPMVHPLNFGVWKFSQTRTLESPRCWRTSRTRWQAKVIQKFGDLPQKKQEEKC